MFSVRRSKELMFAAVVLGCCALVPAADLLVDDFTDANATVENWSATWLGDTTAPVPGAGLGARTRQVFPIGFANKDAQYTTISGDGVYQYGLDPQTANFTLIAASDRTADAEKYQSVGLQAVRSTAYDASGHQYVRFTAWMADPQPSYAITNDAQMVLTFTDSLSRMSVGPWDATGTTLTGVTIETTPTVHVVRIAETTPTIMKVDPIFTAIFGTTSVDWTDVRAVGVGLRRSGAPAGAASFGGIFYLDDLMFLDAEPAFVVSAPASASINESGVGNSTTFTIKLSAMPSDPVTVSVASASPSQVSVSPSSWTFIASGTPGAGESLYSSEATFTVTATDDAAVEGDLPYNVTISPSGSDLLYSAMAISDASVTVIDDDTSDVRDWKVLD